MQVANRTDAASVDFTQLRTIGGYHNNRKLARNGVSIARVCVYIAKKNFSHDSVGK